MLSKIRCGAADTPRKIAIPPLALQCDPPFLFDDNILLLRLLLLLEKIYILGKIFLQNFDDVSVSGVWGIIVCVVQVK